MKEVIYEEADIEQCYAEIDAPISLRWALRSLFVGWTPTNALTEETEPRICSRLVVRELRRKTQHMEGGGVVQGFACTVGGTQVDGEAS